MKIESHKSALRAARGRATGSLIVSTVLLFSGELLLAQPNYSIAWSRIAGGGGTCTNGNVSLTGTIGQYDACTPMTGGGYSLRAGFWPGVTAVQTPGAPLLSINRSGSNIIISWAAPVPGYVLQQCTALSGAAWTDVSQAPVDNAGTRSLTVPLTPGNWFFRLKK